MLTGSSQLVLMLRMCLSCAVPLNRVDGIIVALLFFLLLGCLAHACFFSPENFLLVWFSYLRGCK